MIDGKVQKRLELTDETVRNKVRGLKLPEQMRELFTSPSANTEHEAL